jgi:hypothetical protein
VKARVIQISTTRWYNPRAVFKPINMDMPIPDEVSRDLKPAVLAAPVVQAWQPKKYIGKLDAKCPAFYRYGWP